MCGSLFTKHTPKCHLCAISAVKGSELHSLRKAVLTTLSVLLAPRRSSCLVWKAAVKLCVCVCVCVCVCFAGEGGRVILCFSIAAAAAKSLQSCPTLCDPRDGSPPDSPVPGILQARTLEWVAISF